MQLSYKRLLLVRQWNDLNDQQAMDGAREAGTKRSMSGGGPRVDACKAQVLYTAAEKESLHAMSMDGDLSKEEGHGCIR